MKQRAEVERQLIERLREIYGGTPWLVAGEVAQGIVGGAEALRSYGASDVLAVASRTGVGELPDDVRVIISDGALVGEDASMIERMHDNNRELHDLPQWVIDEVDAWDPDRRAQVIVGFTADAGLVADRPTFGARPADWAELEDKLAIRALWQSAGIDCAADRVVSLDDPAAAVAAHDALSSRLGSAWAVDNRNGWHGGGSGTHWVPTDERAAELAAELAERHDAVRIQPFLEGVPCSIHGLVLADATLAFRPCELIVLLDTVSHEFVYSRAATFWDPEPGDREQMRDVARAIGDSLRARVDFRCVFTVDGVLTAEGFRPTEVNPRFGAALPPSIRTADGDQLRLYFVHLAAVAGELDGIDPDRLERLIVERLDQQRAGSAFVRVARGPGETERRVSIAGTVMDGRVVELRVAQEDDTPLIVATWGNDPQGGLIFGVFTDDMPVGPPVAPTVLAMRKLLSDHWDLALPELTPPFSP